MEHPSFRKKAALRIDVDFAFGWQQAVPYMLDRLQRHGMQATFFVTCSNPVGGLVSRMSSFSYVRRLWGLRAWRLRHVLGRDVLGEDGILAGDTTYARDMIQRIVAEGHEFGLHGYDHRWWTDHVWNASRKEIELDVERAYGLAHELGAEEPIAWASPAWRTSDDVVRMLHARDARYLSDCWGAEPFYVRTQDGEVVPLLQLPVTVRSFEHPSLRRKSAGHVIDACIEGLGSDSYSLVGLHDYFEGGLRRDLFETLLVRCREAKIQLVTLSALATSVKEVASEVPTCTLKRIPLEGFSRAVSWQAP